MTYQLTAEGGVVLTPSGPSLPLSLDPKNRDVAEYLRWLALGNLPAAYVAPPETAEDKQAKKNAALALIDAASTRAIRELVLDQAGVVSLTPPERAAARDRLKQENDKANSERAK